MALDGLGVSQKGLRVPAPGHRAVLAQDEYAVTQLQRQVDVLLCASSMDPPCRIDRPADIERTYPRQARTPFNVTGHPAISVPCGTVGGLPVGLMLVSAHWSEEKLLKCAELFENISISH